MAEEKKNRRPRTALWSAVLAGLLVVVIVANILCFTTFYGILTTFFSGGEKTVTGEGKIYYTPTTTSHDNAIAASWDLIREIQSEGTVLLKNDGFLPLSGGQRVTLFGRDSVDFMYGGGGSGGLSTNMERANLKDALEADGFVVNPVMWDFIESTMEKYPRGDSTVGKLLSVGEIPFNEYTEAVKASYIDYNDAAIVVIGRSGSEAVDLYTGNDQDSHALELGADEVEILGEACSNFENVIVIINASSTLELGFIEEYPQIRAALYVGFTGDTGLEVIGDILNGNVNPSGHTVDTFAYDLTTAPSYANISSEGFEYSNLSDHWFVEYEEGIYVGYRWYETADVEGFWSSEYARDRWGVEHYEDVVQFPFGYGLSYTTFDWNVANWEIGSTGGQISVTIEVHNTGDIAGKDVVQLYFTAPYDPSQGIEKSAVVLGGFAKTNLIPAGETDTVTITMNYDDMASYDYQTEKAYVLSAGEYTLSLRTDAHTVKDMDGATQSFVIDEDIIYQEGNPRNSDNIAAENLFDDVSSHIETYLSRANFVETMPAAPTDADKVASQAVIEGVQNFIYDTYQNAAMPTMEANNGTVIVDLYGKDYTDPLWDTLLDNMSKSELVKLVSVGGYKTSRIDSIAKPPTVDPDGPGGFASFFTDSIYGSGFPSEVIIASTWNTVLAEEMGRSIGEEGLQGGYSGWYAPGMNIHRSPFSGRNFEYYSEDGLLSGKIGAAVVRGCAEKGVYCYVKHFALNDQETHRNSNGLLTWSNEQAMREVYLRPFEIAVKEGKTTAIMSSYNRIGTIWAGGNRQLLTDVLRNEWGFTGMVISDYAEAGCDYLSTDQALSAGGDLMLETVGRKPDDQNSAQALAAMRQASKNILYAVANSHAMNGLESGTSVVTETPSWVKWAVTIDVVALAGIVLGGFFVFKNARKVSKDSEQI